MRVVVKTWTEQVGNAILTHTTTTCPDPECQKKVQSGLDIEKKKRESFEKDKKQREEERLNLKRNTS